MGRSAGFARCIAAPAAVLAVLCAAELWPEVGVAGGASRARYADGATADASEPLRGRKRPSCRRFCQQAGAYGQEEEFVDMSVDILAQTVAPPRNRVVRITGTCNLDRACVGAIILSGLRLEFGRSDLRMPPLATSVIKVTITREAVEFLSERGQKWAKAGIQLKTGDPEVLDLSLSEKLTLLPPDA